MICRPTLLAPAILACVAALAPAAQARPAVGVVSGDTLVRFDTALPGGTSVPITGLLPTEAIAGLDVRPATGELFGLGRIDKGATNDLRLYRIDAETGAASVVGAGSPVSLPDGSWGMDFNPVVDRIRIVSNLDENARLNPSTGGLSGNDTDLTAGASRFVEAVAYDANNPLFPTVTTAFAISRLGELVRIGGTGGTPSANGGVLTVVGPLGLSFPAAGPINLDIAPDGVAFTTYPALIPSGAPRIATVNLVTGAATVIRALEQPLTGFAIRTPVSITAATTVAETDGAAILTAERPVGNDIATIDVATSDGTATAPVDYLAAAGALVFPPGVTSRAIVVPVRADALTEGPETFTVTASSPRSLSLPSVVSSVVTISDVPPGPAIAPSPSPSAAAPKVLLLAPPGASRRTVNRGLSAEIACTAACGATVDLRLGRTTVARSSATLTAAGARVVRLKATRAGSAALAKALRRKRSVALQARGTFTSPGVAAQTVTRAVRVTR